MKLLQEVGIGVPQGLLVARVQPGSIAEELKILPGDVIVAVDEQMVGDILDFQYLTAEDEFTLLIQKPEGEVWEYAIERDPDEHLGLEFEGVSGEGLKYCTNNCVFCFVAQMPPGLRQTLYAKDDDYRLSLMQGSFITLSNLSEAEFERILRLHVSPLYISVHAWDPEARVRLMKNPKTGRVSEQLRRLAEAGIAMHTQIVLVPGYNDGQVLAETVQNLAGLYPAVHSIAVVPVGLTRYRAGLAELRNFRREEARSILEAGFQWQESFRRRFERNLVYFADEFYVLAGLEFPEPEAYDGFPQLENGVGMASKFQEEMREAWSHLPVEISPREVYVITGTSAAGFFQDWAKNIVEHISGLQIYIKPIVNRFFGSEVTVAGLLTAGDIAEQLGKIGGKDFLIPRVMLKADAAVFLDDRDIAWLEKQVDGRCVVVENEGREYLAALIGELWEGDLE